MSCLPSQSSSAKRKVEDGEEGAVRVNQEIWMFFKVGWVLEQTGPLWIVNLEVL